MGTKLCFKQHRESHFWSQKTIVSALLSVIIFTGRSLPPSPFMSAWDAHKQHQGYIYSYHRVQNFYQLFKNPWFDINAFFFYFYMSPLPILIHIVTKGIRFRSVLLSMLLNYKTNCRDVSSTGSYPFLISMDTHIRIPYHPYGNEAKLGFKRNRGWI